MAFVREIQHFRRHLESLQRCEQIEALRSIDPVIVLAVNYQRGRFEFGGEEMRRPFRVQFPIFPGRTFKLPFGEPEFFRRAVGGFCVEHAVV